MTTTFPSVSTSNKKISRETNMAAHLQGSSIQADALQTLYLMNPGYSGYNDPSNVGNMAAINPHIGLDEDNTLPSSIQQHFFGFSLPGLLQNSLSPQVDAVPPMLSSTIAHQLSNRNRNQAYNSWNGQNEMPVITQSDIAQVSQSITACLPSINAGHQMASDFTCYSVNHQSLSPLQGQPMTLFQTSAAHDLNLDNTNQVSAGPSQQLSLSLSPQQPSESQLRSFHMQINESGNSHCRSSLHVASDGNSTGGERHTYKRSGNLNCLHAFSRDGTVGTGYQNAFSGIGCSKLAHLESGASIVGGRLLANSRYLEAAQQLLVEVVSFGREIKIKSAKAQICMGSSFVFDYRFPNDKLAVDTQGKTGTVNLASFSEPTTEKMAELTPIERQELQMKKAKLVEMIEEFDQRYRRYYSQLRIVVSSFESTAGLGAARTYTALALQTISRHFRCLRDAIAGQIRAANKSLGEEEDPITHGKSQTSRLCFVDQQLQGQQSLQQLGMMQQHAWRPQRGLPERAVSILRAWLFEHFLHPYPKDADKMMLAKQTGLTRSQVSNWFINARVRLWKPMVEEMYLEETREAGVETGGLEKKTRVENTENTKNDSTINGSVNGGESHQSKKVVKVDAKQDTMQEHNLSNLIQCSEIMNLAGTASDSQLFHDDSLRQGLVKSRNQLPDSVSTLSPSMCMDMGTRLHDNQIEGIEDKLRIEEGCYRNNFTSSHGAIMHAESLNSFGSYTHVGGMSTRYPGNRNVSLTLGLQQCDGISLSGQQQKHHSHGQNIQVGRQEGAGNESDDYYNLNESSVDQGSMYEAMNIYNRKRFAARFLQHDFVA